MKKQKEKIKELKKKIVIARLKKMPKNWRVSIG